MRTTCAACSRGRRSGAAGTTVAATRATPPPIRASVHPVHPALGSGSSVVTTIDCTAAWMTNTCPLSSRIAVVIASPTIRVICQAPVPMTRTRRSAPNTPSATPTVTSRDPPQPLAVRRAERDHGRHRREERGRVTDDLLGEPPGDACCDRALGDRPPLGTPAVEPMTDRGATPAQGDLERTRHHDLDHGTTDRPRRAAALVPGYRSREDRSMVHPLDPTAAGFLMAENRRMPMHVGGLQLFTKPEGAGRNYVRDLYTQLIESEDIGAALRSSTPTDRSAPPVSGCGSRTTTSTSSTTSATAPCRSRGASASSSSCAPACTPRAWPPSGRCGSGT